MNAYMKINGRYGNAINTASLSSVNNEYVGVLNKHESAIQDSNPVKAKFKREHACIPRASTRLTWNAQYYSVNPGKYIVRVLMFNESNCVYWPDMKYTQHVMTDRSLESAASHQPSNYIYPV